MTSLQRALTAALLLALTAHPLQAQPKETPAPKEAPKAAPKDAPKDLAPSEKDWRDAHNPELRDKWNEMESKGAPSLESLTGWMNTSARSWKDLEGKVVLVDFWATWCGPCIGQMPKLKGLHEKYSEKGLVILGVHSATGADKMEKYVTDEKLPWPFAKDEKRTFSQAFAIQFIPCYFLVDKKGTVRVAGANRDKLEEIIQQLLKEDGKPVDPKELVGKFPKAVDKKVFAANDLRGKAAPKLEVEQWLGDAPRTEGKVVLIHYWATWCNSCAGMVARYNQLQETFKDDLVIIGITEEPADEVKSWIDKTTIGYALAVDSKNKMKDAIGVQAIPHVVIISSDGIVRWQGMPYSSIDRLGEDTLRKIIAADPAVFARKEKKTAAK